MWRGIPFWVCCLAFTLFVCLGQDSQGWRVPPNLRHWGGQHCSVRLVESIPENLTYDGSLNHTSTYEAWKTLINLATKSIHIASFYWTMTGKDVMNQSVPSSYQGEAILNELVKKASQVNVRIANNGPPQSNPNLDLIAKQSMAEVRWVDFPKLGIPGILHTKLWLVDERHAYLGSANMDFRSLTQVKELGLLFLNCGALVSDLEVMFLVYWYLGQENISLPILWPELLAAKSNITHKIPYDSDSDVYFASSPPQFSTPYRSQDIDALLHAIKDADKFVYFSVMDYAPLIVTYTHPGQNIFWPEIDNALREAAVIRHINLRLLISRWNHTSQDMVGFLSSLQNLNRIPHVNIEVKLFIVPAFTPEQEKIPYGRVNHNKYMVTDKCAYIGTSNWSGDYFTRTGGISATISSSKQSSTRRRRSSTEEINFDDDDLRSQTEQIFLRDWNSNYAHTLNEVYGRSAV